MDELIKEAWATALESGLYKQGKGALQRSDTFCCLGVLCDLAVKAEVATEEKEKSLTGGVAYTAGGETMASYLPYGVVQWAGVDSTTPEVTHKGQLHQLAHWNDQGESFETIAKLIREQL